MNTRQIKTMAPEPGVEPPDLNDVPHQKQRNKIPSTVREYFSLKKYLPVHTCGMNNEYFIIFYLKNWKITSFFS